MIIKNKLKTGIILAVLVFAAFLFSVFIFNANNNNLQSQSGLDLGKQDESAIEEPLIENNQLYLLEDYYGDWAIIDDDKTNLYGAVAKDVSEIDYGFISISQDKIVLNYEEIENPVIEIKENIDADGLLEYARTDISQFGFNDNICDIVNISIAGRIVFSFLTDGEKLYYAHLGTYFIMERQD